MDPLLGRLDAPPAGVPCSPAARGHRVHFGWRSRPGGPQRPTASLLLASRLLSFFDRDLRGEHIFANPDFALIANYIAHFKAEQQRSPHDTSLTL
eukprot:3640995-Pyramimonas_sp.AAC.1